MEIFKIQIHPLKYRIIKNKEKKKKKKKELIGKMQVLLRKFLGQKFGER